MTLTVAGELGDATSVALEAVGDDDIMTVTLTFVLLMLSHDAVIDNTSQQFVSVTFLIQCRLLLKCLSTLLVFETEHTQFTS